MTRRLRVLGIVAMAVGMMMTVPVTASAAAGGRTHSPSPATVQSSGLNVTTANADSTVHGCPFEDFCVYPFTNFGSSSSDPIIKMFTCTFAAQPYGTEGSWVNNQTAGTRAAFYNINKGFLNNTAPAFAEDGAKNWANVFWVKPC